MSKKYLGAFVRYNNKPEMGGEAFGPFINIKPKYKKDVGLHVHEYWHVLQWYFWIAVFAGIGAAVYAYIGDIALASVAAGFGLVFHNAAYAIFKPYRYFCEIQCYRKQIAEYPKGHSIEFAVNALVRKYGFKVSEAKVRKDLTK